MTHHHREGEPKVEPPPATKPVEPRDPALTPTADEKALLGALLAIDAEIRAAATHLGPKPGDGLGPLIKRIIERDLGIDLP